MRVCVGPRMAGPPTSMMNHEGCIRKGGRFSSFVRDRNARGPYIALFSAIAYEKLAGYNQGTPLLFGEGVFSHKNTAGSTEDGGCC